MTPEEAEDLLDTSLFSLPLPPLVKKFFRFYNHPNRRGRRRRYQNKQIRTLRNLRDTPLHRLLHFIEDREVWDCVLAFLDSHGLTPYFPEGFSRWVPDQSDEDGCRRLWAYCLQEAVNNCMFYSRPDLELTEERHTHRDRKSYEWIMSEAESPGSFLWVCTILDIDPERIQNRIEEFLFEDVQSRFQDYVNGTLTKRWNNGANPKKTTPTRPVEEGARVRQQEVFGAGAEGFVDQGPRLDLDPRQTGGGRGEYFGRDPVGDGTLLGECRPE